MWAKQTVPKTPLSFSIAHIFILVAAVPQTLTQDLKHAAQTLADKLRDSHHIYLAFINHTIMQVVRTILEPHSWNYMSHSLLSCCDSVTVLSLVCTFNFSKCQYDPLLFFLHAQTICTDVHSGWKCSNVQLSRAPVENLNEISLRLLFMCMCEVPPKCMRKHNVNNRKFIILNLLCNSHIICTGTALELLEMNIILRQSYP